LKICSVPTATYSVLQRIWRPFRARWLSFSIVATTMSSNRMVTHRDCSAVHVSSSAKLPRRPREQLTHTPFVSEAESPIASAVGLAIAAGSDGSGAARQVSRICQGWRLKPVVDTPLIVQNGLPQTAANILAPKACSSEAAARCQELGGLVAAHVLLRVDDAQ